VNGFDDAGEFAAGSVYGARWWQLRQEDDRLRLLGMRDYWEPGENTARCLGEFMAHDVPARRCGCGFWAYWEPQSAGGDPSAGPAPVLGVIQGYGRTLIGPKGFRCAKARIVAICLGFQVMRRTALGACNPQRYRPPPGMFRRGPQGMETYHALTGAGGITDGWKPSADGTRAFQIMAEQELGIPVYGSAAAMLAMHPLTTDYLPEPAKPAKTPFRTVCARCGRLIAYDPVRSGGTWADELGLLTCPAGIFGDNHEPSS